MVNRLGIYSDYADGYCEDYVPPQSALFALGGATFAPSRLPGYPVYVMQWDQASSESAGAATLTADPYVQELLVTLTWAGMSGTDKAALVSFWRNNAVGMTNSFSLYLPSIGPVLPVRFATDILPAMPEVGYDRYRVELVLRVNINYPQRTAVGTPVAATGFRFSVGAAVFSFAIPLRVSGGTEERHPQTLERNSAGAPVIYAKSRLQLNLYRLAMVLDFDAWVRFQALWFTYAHGGRNKVTWTDQNGVARTVRLSGKSLTIQQTAWNRLETELTLLEEI